MIELKNISKVYVMGEGEQVVRALDKINLTIKDGEYIAIIGPSGSGKSTLMNVLGCLDNPSKGQYLLNGKDVSKLRDDQLADVRNHNIGFVFQRFNLMGRMSAIRNVEMPARYGGIGSRERHKRAIEALTAVGLAKRMNHTPVELSGGQQQRVAIARALVNQPNILLADEPTGALDSKTGRDILNLFERLHKERGITIIVVTHDPNIARRAERVVSIRDGRIESDTLTANMPAAAAAAVAVPVPVGIGDGAEARRLAALNHLGAMGAGVMQDDHLNHVATMDHHDEDAEHDGDSDLIEQDTLKPSIRLAGRDVLKRGLIAIVVAAVINVGLGLLVNQLMGTANRLPFFAPLPVAAFTILFGLLGLGVFAMLNQKAQQPMRLFRSVAGVALLLSFVPNVIAISNPTAIAPIIAIERQLSGQSATTRTFNRANGQFGQGQAGQTDQQQGAGADAGAGAGAGANANRQGQAGGGGGFRGGGPFGALFGGNNTGGRTGTNFTFPMILLMVMHVVAYGVIINVFTRKPSLRAIDLDLD